MGFHLHILKLRWKTFLTSAGQLLYCDHVDVEKLCCLEPVIDIYFFLSFSLWGSFVSILYARLIVTLLKLSFLGSH